MQDWLAVAPPSEPLTVTELNQRLRLTVEQEFGTLQVTGEICDFRLPSSGHLYFGLKDASAQIAAVMFRGPAQRLRFRPANGDEVVVRGRITVYEPRGTLQIRVEQMEPVGAGAALRALEELRRRLAAEGLFAEERKRPLPAFPDTVGVVTARSGAAIHDILVTLKTRMPSADVLLRPVRVQGAEAPREIVAALQDLAESGRPDVVIVGRGGGSAEDLGAFNDERVVRAIAACPVPVIAAVGHEIDITLADLVADRRAATPTAAAAAAVADRREWTERVELLAAALTGATRRGFLRRRGEVASLAARLRDPRTALRQRRDRVVDLSERLLLAMDRDLERRHQAVDAASEHLRALSPLAVLGRGYSLVTHAGSGRILRHADDISPGEDLRVRFAAGEATARVLTCTPAPEPSEGSDHENQKTTAPVR